MTSKKHFSAALMFELYKVWTTDEFFVDAAGCRHSVQEENVIVNILSKIKLFGLFGRTINVYVSSVDECQWCAGPANCSTVTD